MQVVRPTFIALDRENLLHNITFMQQQVPQQAIMAIVKANAYGCGIPWVVPILAPHVFGFGVACIEEALLVRQYAPAKACLLLEGVFAADELDLVLQHELMIVVHHMQQLEWLRALPISKFMIKVWIKVDTGMHRLGFALHELPEVLAKLQQCANVDRTIGLMTHFASADEPDAVATQKQLKIWKMLVRQYSNMPQSFANSAAIMVFPSLHANVARPGLALYGASPFPERVALDLGLKPVMRLMSKISAIHSYEQGEAIGYGGAWRCQRPSIIGVVPLGYGDGYPRHIQNNTPAWVKGQVVPVVGRVSMDMLTVDLSDHPNVSIGDEIELWGKHIPVEHIAKQAGTIAYELMTRVSQGNGRLYRVY